MIKKLAHYFDARSLERAQRRAAQEMQMISDTRLALALREKYLLRLSAQLTVRELDMHITARRDQRAATW